MSSKSFLVEIILCEYVDDKSWHGDGIIIREFTSKKDARAFIRKICHLLKAENV